MNAVQGLPEPQKAEFMKHIEDLQLVDSLRMYNRVVEQCFDDCVTGGFRSKKLEEKELSCVNKCAEKFVKHTQRVGVRFSEAQSALANQS